MLSKSYIFIALSILVSSCFPGSDFFEQASIDSNEILSVGVNVVGEVTSALIDPSSGITQTVEVPDGSTLEGTSLSIPAGALNVSMSISIEEVQSPASDISLAELGIESADTSSVATVFSNDQGVDQFSGSEAGTIQVQTSSTTSLRLLASNPRAMYARHRKSNGVCYDSVYLLSSENFVSKNNKEFAQFKTPYFGAYQVITLENTNFPDIPVQTDWGTTRLAQLPYSGACDVLTKTQKDQLNEAKPISLGAITTSLNSQVLTLSATSISEAPSSCSILLTNGTDAPIRESASSSSISIDLDEGGLYLNASTRFQCTFLDGRILSTNSVDLPAGIQLSMDTSTRQVTITTDHSSSSSCVLDAYHADDSTNTFTETVSSSSQHVLDFSSQPADIDYYARVVCTSSNGTSTQSPYIRFDLGVDTTVPVGPPLPNISSFLGINEASDGYINFSEKTSSLDAWSLVASDYATVMYTSLLDDSSTITCDSSHSYDQSIVPTINQMTSETAWVICVKIENSASDIIYGKSQQIIRDITSPIVTTISSAQSDPTTDATINMTINFSEDVSGLTLGDLAISNGTATNLVASSTSVYTFDIIPSLGLVTVDLPASAVSDNAGNASTAASTFSINFQYAPPPDPTSLIGTDGSGVDESGTESMLTWNSGGGTTSGYTIAYMMGPTAPADCNTGTIVNASGTSHLITGLLASDQFSFRVCAVNSNITPDVSSGITLTVNLQSWELEVTTISASEIMGIGFDDAVDIAIDWGDGGTDTVNSPGVNSGSTSTITHPYTTGGTYTLKIRGQAGRVNFDNPEAATRLSGILTPVIGISGITSFERTFYNVTGLVGSIPIGLFDKNPNVTSFSFTFSGASGLTGPIPANLFNLNTAVTTFFRTFYGASGLTGSIPANLFDFNTAVTDFSGTFSGASGLTGPIPANLFDFNTAVTTFANTFDGASGLTGPIPTGLFDNNTNVTTFSFTFFGTYGLTAIPAGLFDFNTAVTTFSGTFYNATGLTGPIPMNLFDFNTAVTDFSSTFSNASGLAAIPAGLFDNNSAVTTFASTFDGASGLAAIPAGLFNNNPNVTTFEYTFDNASGLTGPIPMNLFDSNTAVTNFTGTFRGASGLTSIPAGLFDNNTSVTSFSQTFSGASGLTSVPTNLFDSNTAVTTFGNTFYQATSIVSAVPDIWVSHSGVGSFVDCFTGVTGATNYGSIPTAWGGP